MPVLTSSIINSAEIKDKIYYIWDDMVKGFALKVTLHNKALIYSSLGLKEVVSLMLYLLKMCKI